MSTTVTQTVPFADVRTGDVVRVSATRRARIESQYSRTAKMRTCVAVWTDHEDADTIGEYVSGRLTYRAATTVTVERTELGPRDLCPKCGDFAAWCPDYPNLAQHRDAL